MKPRRVLVAALVRLYPRPWRDQYGAELADVLDAQSLRTAIVADVVRGALWQRLRAAAPATMLGTGALLLILGGFVFSPTAYGQTGTALIQPSFKTFPTITVTFFASEFFAVLLLLCGCWTELRYGRGAAKAAMWMTILAGLPVTAFGLLILTGAVSAAIPIPGDPMHTINPSPWAMIIAPVVRTLESALWGAAGGRIGRWLGRASRSARA